MKPCDTDILSIFKASYVSDLDKMSTFGQCGAEHSNSSDFRSANRDSKGVRGPCFDLRYHPVSGLPKNLDWQISRMNLGLRQRRIALYAPRFS